MKLAFSTGSFAEGDFASVSALGRKCGYEAVDVNGRLLDAVVAKAEESRRVCGETEIGVCCLGSGIEFVGSEERDRRSGEQIGKLIDAAAVLACPWVTVGANTVEIGRSAVTGMLGDWLKPLGDRAEKCGVGILLVNQKTFGASRAIWAVLDRLRHPAIGCCWDVFVAAVMGERPGISVPTLNSRIRLARISDAKISADGVVECKLGEGDVAVEYFVKHLRGIGYDGYLTVNSSGGELMLADGAEKLRKWLTGQ